MIPLFTDNFLFLIGLLLLLLEYLIIRMYIKRNKYLSHSREVLYKLREKVLEAKNRDEVYELILQGAIEIIPKASKGSILVEQEDRLFHYVASVGYSEALRNIKLKKEEVFLYAKNKFSDIAVIKNPAKFNKSILNLDKHRIFKATEALDICCTLSCPIEVNDKVIGVINLDSIKRHHIFTEEDIKNLKHVINELKLVLRTFIIQNNLEYIANYDALTGLYNRRFLEYLINYHLETGKHSHKKGTLIFIDLDNFKKINDTCGHGVGDKVLISLANIFKSKMEQSCTYGRMAGDEFIIFIPNSDENTSRKIIEDIRLAYKSIKICSTPLDFSYGIVEVDSDYKDLKALIEEADKRMYEGKSCKNVNKTPFN